MECKVEQQNGEARIMFSGCLALGKIKEMKALLVNVLKEFETVNLDLSKVREADLACLQLLCSAHWTAGGMGKVLKMTGNCSEQFLKAVQTAGYDRHTGCTSDRRNSCLWVESFAKTKAL